MRINRQAGNGKILMFISKLSAAALAGAGLMIAVPALADTKAGVEAWTRGDYPVAIKEWQAGTTRGDADAIFNLGQAYKLGKGVKQDLTRAEQLFAQAAAMGHLQASDNYGLLLFQRGDHARALPYIRAAADRGDPRALYLLGIAHFNGDMVPKDWVRAYALVGLARQQGLAQAGPALAQMDQYIPMEQRQQGVQLAGELQSQADATRARQLAAIDLGNQVPGAPAAALPPGASPRAPALASAEDPLARAERVAGNESPARAGADYARPAAPRPAPAPTQTPRPVVHAGPPPVQASAPPPPIRPASGGTWRIQLGAFGVPANADALWAKASARAELAGHPRLNVKAGAVTKLQAGGFASQAAAQVACSRLQAAGFTCIAVSG